jgi:predicted RND superfamily exporter protein
LQGDPANDVWFMPVLERYTRFVTRRRWLVLLTVLVATAGVAAGILRLHTDFNIESSLPADHPFVRIDREIRREFGGRNTVIVAMVPRDGEVWRPEVLAVVRDATLAALRLPGVIAQNVVSLAAPSVRYVEESGGAIKVDYLMRDVPQTADDIARLRARVEEDPQTRGMLVTPDQRAAILVVDFWEGPTAIELCNRVRGIADAFRDKPIDFYFAGEPIFALMDVEQSAEVAQKIPLTFLVIGLVLLISFRNLQGMFVPMLTAALSTVWGLGLMGWTGVAIDSWNVAVPILLIAIASGHSAQMLKRYAEEVAKSHDNRAAVIESTVKMGPVMIAAGMTAALGFASLALFGVRSIANFGLSCAYGISSAVVLEMTFIPALRAILPAPRRMAPAGGPTQRLLESLQRGILRNHGRPVLIGTAVAIGLALLGSTRIHTFGSTRVYMPKDSVPRRHLEEIEKHFPGTVTLTILYEGEPGSVKTVGVLQHMAALQAELERNPLVLRTASVADLVKTLHKTFNSDAPNPYRIPDDQELIAQLMFLGESPAFERFTDRAQSKALVMSYLRDDDSALVGPLIRHIEDWVAAHPAPAGMKLLIAGGAGPTILAVQEHTTYGKLLNMLVVLAAIYLVASVVLRSPSSGLYVICPIAISVVLLFGFLGWANIRLDMGSSSLLAMSAGVGADYAIYFLYRLREERARCGSDAEALGVALQTSGRAVLFVATSIGAGFGVMAISKFRGLYLFGMLMPLAMAISCLAALSIMPVLVLRVRPRFVFGESVDAVPAGVKLAG